MVTFYSRLGPPRPAGWLAWLLSARRDLVGLRARRQAESQPGLAPNISPQYLTPQFLRLTKSNLDFK